jgi:hypothetical protein
VPDYMGSSGVEFYPPNLSQVETRLGVLEGTVLEENLYDNKNSYRYGYSLMDV